MELDDAPAQVTGGDSVSTDNTGRVPEVVCSEIVPDEPPVPSTEKVTEVAPHPVAREDGAVQAVVDVYDPTPVIRGYDVSADEKVEEPLQIEKPAASTTDETAMANQVATNAPHSDQVIANDVPPMVQDSPAVIVSCDAPTTANATVGKAVEPVVHPVDPVQARLTEAWSLMFGSRYEDPVSKEDPRSGATRNLSRQPMRSPRPTNKTLSSLRRKLDQERLLDEQIQGARSKIRKRPGSDESDRSSHATKQPLKTKPPSWLAEDRPFEDAGLTPTAVRFCVEKAMASSVHCIARLHAIAQGEPEPAGSDIPLGLFVTQWELAGILADLLRDRSASAVSTHLYLHNPEYVRLPLETLLQVSWFLPLDQFSRLRTLVAEISRKRLSEGRVALLNGVLHRHFVLRPHPGIKMQRLLLRIVILLTAPTNTNQDPEDETRKAAKTIVIEFLHALHVRIPSGGPEISIADFMVLSPFELVARFQLTSVISIQRIMFFRFLIEVLAQEKTSQEAGKNNWWPRSTGKPSRQVERCTSETVSEASTPVRSVSKRKRRPPRFYPPKEEAPEVSDEDEQQTDAASEIPIASTIATHGSASSPREKSPLIPVTVVEETPSATFLRLNDTLTASLSRLVRINPWLVDDNQESSVSQASTATRASFLAAEAFQQSLVLLQASETRVTSSILVKIEEFISIIDDLARRIEQKDDGADDTAPESAKPTSQSVEPAKPPPLPIQRANSGSFPSPYTARSPSYWTFEPEMPPPSTPTPATCSIPRSMSKAKASPGVGDYDVSRSDRLKFPQQGGHTFSKGGLATVDESGPRTPPAKAASKRKQRFDRVNSTDSLASSTDLPTYTHWASAATDKTSLGGSEEADEEDAIDVQVRDALRLQQSFVLDDLVQSLLHRRQPSKTLGPRKPHLGQKTVFGTPNADRPPQSRAVARLRSVTARTAEPKTKTKPRPPSPPPYEKPVMRDVKQPPRDYEPPVDEAHLQWAARVSELYKAKLKAAGAAELRAVTSPQG